MKSLVLDRVATTTATGAAVTAPIPALTDIIYPPFLTTHGWLDISFAEWMQIVGVIYIAVKIFSIVRDLYKDIRQKKNNVGV